MGDHGGRLRGRGLAAVLLCALLAACGGDDGDGEVVLPDGPRSPRAYTERYLRENPHAVLRLTHLAIADLERSEDPDRFPYFVEAPVRLQLEIDPGAELVATLVLRNAGGGEVNRSGQGAVSLARGRHDLEIWQRSDRPDLERMTVFVRPESLPDGGVVLRASANCTDCDFDDSQLDGQNFDGVDLSGSYFQNASISDSTFRGAKLVNCDLSGEILATEIDGCDFGGADLSGAKFDFTNVGQFTIFGGPSPTPPANLTNTSWGTVLGEDDLLLIGEVEGVTFANATLAGARFAGVQLDGIDFRGADLSGADFTASGPLFGGGQVQTQCLDCNFSVEPSTGNHTDLSNAILSAADTNPVLIEPGTDFSGARLAGAQLAGAAFGGLTFDGADFSQAKLAGTQFGGSSFEGAVLDGADLANADLARVAMRSATFDGATLTSAQLGGADLRDTSFTDANLDAAVLDGAELGGATFSGASFAQASLQGVDLYAQDLHGLNFSGASLRGTVLDYSDLEGANLSGAVLGVPDGSSVQPASMIAVYMPNVNLASADLRNVDLSGAHLYGDSAQTSLDQTLLDGATLVNAICSGAQFTQASLNGAVLDGAQLVNCTFVEADLTNARLDTAYLQGADFSGAASVAGVDLSNAAVATVAGTWQFTEQNGQPIVYAYGATELGEIATQSDVVCPNGQAGPCVGDKLQPVMNGPFPPIPTCVPAPPCYDNCTAPVPPPTPTPQLGTLSEPRPPGGGWLPSSARPTAP